VARRHRFWRQPPGLTIGSRLLALFSIVGRRPSFYPLPPSFSPFTLFANTIPEAETMLSIAYAAERALLVEPTAMVSERAILKERERERPETRWLSLFER